MPETPHSREWYTRLAHDLGGYGHAWTRVLSGPDPELTFDLTLAGLLTPQTWVLEAGCGHGPDAARFGPQVRQWTAYDFVPALLEQARRNAPQVSLVLWDGKGKRPTALHGSFDLIVSRRGPTSVILRLPELAAPGARFLYVGPRLDVPQVPRRLDSVGWTITSEWRVSVLAHAPTREDWQSRCDSMGEEASREDWAVRATAAGMPYREERYVVLAQPAGMN
ncbi:class I SAM-dependent methyltransferase [Deinococcus navajonensis]|uniref:Class I SAM-dependent methyltransferase n=1 Tax=Deinococcus navajonensis TaxID=309884 RepID=A0ABV8XNL0_9DEIO